MNCDVFGLCRETMAWRFLVLGNYEMSAQIQESDFPFWCEHLPENCRVRTDLLKTDIETIRAKYRPQVDDAEFLRMTGEEPFKGVYKPG